MRLGHGSGCQVNPDTILDQGGVCQRGQPGQYVPSCGTAQSQQGRNIEMIDRISQRLGQQIRA
jgi:hypothetical protein